MRIPYVSPSRLKKAKHCDFQYFLSYEWFWADKLFTYAFASEFGSAVHNTLEAYAKSKCQLDYKKRYDRQTLTLQTYTKKDMTAAPKKARAAFFIDKECKGCPFFDGKNKCKVINQNVEEFKGCPKNLHQAGILMIEQAIERYFKYFITGIKSEENPKGKVIGIEYPADISWGLDDEGNDIPMNGFIDLVVEYDEETLLIVDYKTGFSIPSHEDFLKDLQPRMYSYAARRLLPDYKYYWTQFDYFRGVPIEHAFTASDDECTRREVVALYNSIKNKQKVTRRVEDYYCKWLCNRPFCNQKWEELISGEDGRNPDWGSKEGRK